LHAPDYASLAGFWTQHDLGPQCRTLDQDDLVAALECGLCPTDEQARSWITQIDHVHRDVLSQSQFESGVRELLGIEAAAA
jgi:hypothetical protein